MVWFYCDRCSDSIKKPKVAAHLRQCPGATFTCIDCSRTFDSSTVHSHNSCVTEQQKYALGATKPGGIAATGFFDDGVAKSPAEAVGHEFLATRAPWNCSICNVACTSQDTLVHHAAGAKHKRRVKAALAARQPASAPAADCDAKENGATAATESPADAPEPEAEDGKRKKRKCEAAQDAAASEPGEAGTVDDAGADGAEVREASALMQLALRKLKKKGGSMGLGKLVKLLAKQQHSDDELNAFLQELVAADGSSIKVAVSLG